MPHMNTKGLVFISGIVLQASMRYLLEWNLKTFHHFHKAHTIISWGKKQDAPRVEGEKVVFRERGEAHSHHLPLGETDSWSERQKQEPSSSPT